MSRAEGDLNELEQALGHIWKIAGDFGLDPFPVGFEVVPAHIIYGVGAYGLPDHYSHWTHGRAYRQMKTMYDQGLSRIYEVVVNSNPAQAFLLDNNAPVDNKLVMAHVLGHSEFFKQNRLFQDTRKDMPGAASLAAHRFQGYEIEEGKREVEEFLDAALSISEHIDPFHPTRLSPADQLKTWKVEFENRQQGNHFRPTSEFDDLFDDQIKKPVAKKQQSNAKVPFPLDPERDVLGFIRDFAPYLEDWQRDVLDVVRTESLYFYPQMRTKIMNEGWASFWHRRIMREMADRGHLTQAEDIRWWQLNAGVVSANNRQLNPYHFGLNMFEYLVDLHNGDITSEEKRWLEKEGLPVYPKHDGDFLTSPGLAAVRQIMETEDDQSFIRNHFTRLPADRMQMYIYDERPTIGPFGSRGTEYYIKERGWEKIRDGLVQSMINGGNPVIVVKDGDFDDNQELYLEHRYEGRELRRRYLSLTLPQIYKLWGRSVNLETVVDGKKVVYSFDGDEFYDGT